MKIWVAAITHKHGTSVFTATTRDRLIHELHRYVKAWWSQEHPEEPFPDDAPKEEAVDLYFEELGHEYLEFIEETELAGSD